MIKSKPLIWVFFLFAIVSCDNNRVFEQNVSFANEQWHADSVITFTVDIMDTLSVYNVYFNNRINGKYGYKYQNMYVFIDTYLPHSNHLRDTLECILADNNGKWLGKGFGSIWANQIPYKTRVRFPYAGTYTFTIEQAMRDTILKNVVDAGLRIEKAKL